MISRLRQLPETRLASQIAKHLYWPMQAQTTGPYGEDAVLDAALGETGEFRISDGAFSFQVCFDDGRLTASISALFPLRLDVNFVSRGPLTADRSVAYERVVTYWCRRLRLIDNVVKATENLEHEVAQTMTDWRQIQ